MGGFSLMIREVAVTQVAIDSFRRPRCMNSVDDKGTRNGVW
jgi:hypothetical protein